MLLGISSRISTSLPLYIPPLLGATTLVGRWWGIVARLKRTCIHHHLLTRVVTPTRDVYKREWCIDFAWNFKQNLYTTTPEYTTPCWSHRICGEVVVYSCSLPTLTSICSPIGSSNINRTLGSSCRFLARSCRFLAHNLFASGKKTMHHTDSHLV
jgi:hypothetical protein